MKKNIEFSTLTLKGRERGNNIVTRMTQRPVAYADVELKVARQLRASDS